MTEAKSWRKELEPDNPEADKNGLGADRADRLERAERPLEAVTDVD